MIRVEEFLTEDGRSPFRRWFDRLDGGVAATVSVAISRLAAGNRSSTKSIGEGAAEIRIDKGPGYRIYFGWDGDTLVILLGGGTKRRRQDDIATALGHWRDYKARKSARRK